MPVAGLELAAQHSEGQHSRSEAKAEIGGPTKNRPKAVFCCSAEATQTSKAFTRFTYAAGSSGSPPSASRAWS